MPIFPRIFGDIYSPEVRAQLPRGYSPGGAPGPLMSYLHKPMSEVDADLRALWARSNVPTKMARQTSLFMNRGFGSGLGALIGGGVGAAGGGVWGAIGGGLAGGFLGGTPTGFQAAGMALGGAAIGGMVGGAPGAFVGAVGGGALGAMGPFHTAGKVWRSGTAGKVGLGAIGALGLGTVLAANVMPGGGTDMLMGAGGGLLTGAALAMPVLGAGAMTLPGRGRSIGLMGGGAALGTAALGPMGGIAGGAIGAGVGIGLGIRDLGRGGSAAMKAAGKVGFGATGKMMGSVMSYMATKPGRAGGLLGLALGVSGFMGGLASLAGGGEPVGSMAVGSREALYGMDPNNLDTQALTLALHYRHG